MPTVKIHEESFKGKDGNDVKYSRVIIASTKQPSLVAELRVEKNEIALIRAIEQLDSQSTK